MTEVNNSCGSHFHTDSRNSLGLEGWSGMGLQVLSMGRLLGRQQAMGSVIEETMRN